MGYNPPMETFLAAFAVFALGGLAMAIGVILKGKHLSGSCGGVGPDGESIADCLCERLELKRGSNCPKQDDSTPGAHRDDFVPLDDLVNTARNR